MKLRTEKTDAITIYCSRTLGWRLGLQAVTGSAISLFFLGLFYRSASLYHPQRRAILHLKDMSKRKGKDKNKIESKPPYFDSATIKIRSFQVILAAVFVASLGIYTPVFFLVSETFILLDVCQLVCLRPSSSVGNHTIAMGWNYF